MIDKTIKQYISADITVIIASGLPLLELIKSLDIGTKLTIVSDINTHKVLGQSVEKALEGYSPVSLILPDGTANINAVNKISEASMSSDAIIAVGSGTINDLCKYASHLNNKPYAVFGTAPSMNGYSSANASITIDGHKKTLKAHLPRGIFLDLDILSTAPTRLIRSGLGDSLCRPTAQSDWLLSHLLLGTKYNQIPFEILKTVEQPLFENARALAKGDREIVKLLAETLILSGLGMYICGGSYPASQGEHLIAHTMETVYTDLPKTYHGEQIGVTTLTMASIIQHVLEKPPILKNDPVENKILEFFGAKTGEHCLQEHAEKMFEPSKLDDINHRIQTDWSSIANQIDSIMIGENTLRQVLKNAGSHTNCESLGWSNEKYKLATSYAKYMRNRFGFLDLA